MKYCAVLFLIMIIISCSSSGIEEIIDTSNERSLLESPSNEISSNDDDIETQNIDSGDNETQNNESENTQSEGDSTTEGSSAPTNCSKLIGNGPDLEWIKSVEGSEEEAHAHFIFTTNDNGYIQVGETGFLDNNTAKLLIAKTNSDGELIWKKEFGVSGHNLGNSVIEVNDGYIVTGSINKNSTVIKLNKENGSEIWLTTIDNGGTDAIEHIVEAQNGFIGVGYIDAVDENNTFYTEGKGYMTFFDLDGNKTSGKLLDTKMPHAYRISKINNDLIISGLTPGAEDYALMKTNLDGEMQWIKTFGGESNDHCFAMDIANDNSIYLSGHTISGTENWDTYTMKIDQDGNKLWEKKRGNPRGFNPLYVHDEVWDLKATPDGGCIIVAGTGDEYSEYSENCEGSIDNSNSWHVYLIKYSAEGEIQWDKTYYRSDGGDWAGEAIDLTSDGGAIVAVDNSVFGFLKIAPF